jgi:hypothetical protein
MPAHQVTISQDCTETFEVVRTAVVTIEAEDWAAACAKAAEMVEVDEVESWDYHTGDSEMEPTGDPIFSRPQVDHGKARSTRTDTGSTDSMKAEILELLQGLQDTLRKADDDEREFLEALDSHCKQLYVHAQAAEGEAEFRSRLEILQDALKLSRR